MKNIILFSFITISTGVFSQAHFNGNVYDMESKKALKNVKLMVVEETDTSYFEPDEKGDFNFKTKPGRVKVYAVADGFISELNSCNAGDGSVNKIEIALVKESMVKDLEERSVPVAHSYSRSERIGSTSMMSSAVSGWADPESIDYKGSDNQRSGVLTAGEVNDFAKWGLWNDLNKNEFESYSTAWQNKLMERICIQLSLPSGMPVIDAEIDLIDHSGHTIWSGRTDNTGKTELWGMEQKDENRKNYSIKVTSGTFTQSFRNIHSFEKGVNSVKIDVPCTISDQLDIAFVVDATGSMGDEIDYLKMDLDSVITLISAENENINVRMASVFYRDKGDEYLTLEAPFSTNTDLVKSFINSNVAGGGGDYPEAADEALLVALKNLNWSTSSRARILFWVLDAPPHKAEANLNKLLEVSKLAAKMGVKIVPVGCSGIDKSTEFLCRSIALATNGTYTFLTNHSGVGGSHIEPSTDGYKVESFREILVRVSRLMSITPDCEEFIAPEQIVLIDTNLRIDNPYGIKDSIYVNRHNDITQRDIELDIDLYPNPTNGVFNIKNPKEIKEVFITDVNGKILERISLHEDRTTSCDISQYSNGVYFVKFYNSTKWACKRIVLNH